MEALLVTYPTLCAAFLVVGAQQYGPIRTSYITAVFFEEHVQVHIRLRVTNIVGPDAIGETEEQGQRTRHHCVSSGQERSPLNVLFS